VSTEGPGDTTAASLCTCVVGEAYPQRLPERCSALAPRRANHVCADYALRRRSASNYDILQCCSLRSAIPDLDDVNFQIILAKVRPLKPLRRSSSQVLIIALSTTPKKCIDNLRLATISGSDC
jgi:hypothetical protein